MRVSSGADPFLAAALGILLYTTIMSPGYFLARHELPVVGVFAVLVALTIASPIVVFVEHRRSHLPAICPGQSGYTPVSAP